MKISLHRARVSWNGGEDKDVRAHTIELAGEKVAASSAPKFGGDSDRADPEELFVASLSSCHMLWFLALARAEKIGALHHGAHERCFISNSVNCPVEVEPR